MIDQKVTVEELEEEKSKAWRSHFDLTSAKTRRRKELLAAAERTIDEQLSAEFDAEIEAAKKRLDEAEAAFDQAKYEAAISNVGLQYPVGTRMEEWKHATYGREEAKTGRLGIVEVVSPYMDHPANRAEYSRSKPGDLIVRILKADGSPSKLYEALGSDRRWRPSKCEGAAGRR